MGESLTPPYYAVTQLPAPRRPLSNTRLRLLHYTHRLLQDLTPCMLARPLARAAAALARSLEDAPDGPGRQHLLGDLRRITAETERALTALDLPTYVDDLIDVYCDAAHTFTAPP